ncbi:MgtC/SapB family protein [Algicella marina]|uniref:Protein MgtC n=1 Tax=Algicella marina TaxID=2683284 RepID=A0A6P1T0L6_9RHOB|nr:MgtC/SapB family protein [Algicella marina]QHQ35315.1 MgtC/SapB family protein [Algicella marina]
MLREALYAGEPAIGLDVTAIRLVTAMLLGSFIGFERESHDRPAGLRTHMMISLASCLFALVALLLVDLPTGDETALRYDPLRLIEAVTAGVAFLAAGSILTKGDTIKGLTTGASMWLAGAIGLAVGTGNATLALMAAVLGVVILRLLRPLKKGIGEE